MPLFSRIRKILAENKSLLAFVLLMCVFRSAAADWMLVPTGSMNPTIVEGDRILVNKVAYGLRVPFTSMHITQGSDPQRGDIATFTSPKDGTNLVKRVVGVPGDTVEMRDEHLLINGAAVDYAPTTDAADADLLHMTRAEDRYYLREDLAGRAHSIMVMPRHAAMRSFGPVTVPQGCYLMLGDNRDNSEDSRYIGFVPRENILGRAYKVAYSLDPERWYQPRADRLMAPLQ